MTVKKNKEYSAESIQVLDDISHIRLRPSHYVGDTSAFGHFIILKEIIDNALDEGLAGHTDLIRVTLLDNGKGARVADLGRGVPLEYNSKTKLSTLATVFAFAKSGGKFNNDAYATSAGLHGVGATATNALSVQFIATSWRGAQKGTVSFAKGRLQGKDAVIEKNPDRIKHGTMVEFLPDYKEIFTDVTAYDPNQVRQRLLEAAFFLGKKVKVQFQPALDQPAETLPNDGIVGLLKSFSKPTNPAELDIEFTVQVAGEDKTAYADIAFGWTGELDTQPDIRSYVNLSHTKDGGAHHSAFEKALVGFLLDRCRNKCSSKEILEGLVAVVHLRHPNPQFSSQTKEKVVNKDLAKQMVEALEPKLKSWGRKNAAEIDAWLADAARRFEEREAQKDLKKALKDLKTTKRNSRGVLPSKLYEADCPASQRELYLVEGSSAAGSVVKGRNADYQEVLPLKGKILNVFKATDAEVVANKEVQTIFAAIGGGAGNKFNLADCRVSKVILLADADFDGSHISTLLIGLLAKYARPLLEAGMVYSVDAPLFLASLPNGDRVYGHSMDDIREKTGKSYGKSVVTRLKGHGESQSYEVAEYAMNPPTRKLS
jgi:DNA gyrase/topoisomerase IV subunit B